MPDDAELGRIVSEVTVTYSVKELLSRIEERQVRQDEKMGHLASRAEVEAIKVVVQRHEARWNKIIGAAIGVSAVTGGAMGYIANLLSA